MYKISTHPILDIPTEDAVTFLFNNKSVKGQKGFTIAASLHQAGFPIHSHSIDKRERSLECGIGKCGACEMLVDGKIKRICITKVDDVKEVSFVPQDFLPEEKPIDTKSPKKVYKTVVTIIGAGPAGLAVREELNKMGIDNLVIDNNDKIGGQFLMQTHQFFFFEKEKKFGGMRGFDIAKTLAGDSLDGIFLNSVVWDILEGKRLAVKNTQTEEVYYIDAEHVVIACGAVPFMPAFKNDDVPGVYTAAVVQKMMNNELTLLGKNILTIGAGNIGYLTSYQAMQAGANIKAILEAQPNEGGFPVQANRVRRLGIPVMTSHLLLEAIPNKDRTGITGAVIAQCENFKPIKGTEKIIEGIDLINVCTGLIPDNQLLIKGSEVFGRNCHGVGDSVRIGEGTSAVLRGKQCAYEIAQALNKRSSYDEYLRISKEYIDSQQHPFRVIEKPFRPEKERMEAKPFVQIDCLYGFACNPCQFACKYGAIVKSSTSTVPHINYEKCIGCMECVYNCPGLAIFGYNLSKNQLFLPIEYAAQESSEVFLINNNGQKLGTGIIEKILVKPNKTNIARVKSLDLEGEALLEVRGFILKEKYPEPLQLKDKTEEQKDKTYVCHCEDVDIQEIITAIGDRKFISVDELKHITRLGMGPCRGKRCIARVKQIVRSYGIEVLGDATPRGPLSNQIELGQLYPPYVHDTIIIPSTVKKVKSKVLIAGGGIGGSALFRYFAEAGYNPVLVNCEYGSSWRNIAGGRPAFSNPDLADLAVNNLGLFKELHKIADIDYHPIQYVNFAHDEATYKELEASKSWSDAYMVAPKDFSKEISPYINPNLKNYQAALITNNCWQASPGKTVDALRHIGLQKGGAVLESTLLVDMEKTGNQYKVLLKTPQGEYIEYETELFVNALGANASAFVQKLGLFAELYPVKHQAFITRRLPLLGKDGKTLNMLIDRKKYKNFSAVYGQQLAHTGQIIGCASPINDPSETDKNLKINSQEFLEIVSEVFTNWFPKLSSVGFQAVWAGYYVEPRYIIDPELGLFIGLRGHGFMHSQYMAKLYVDVLQGKQVPDYFHKMKLYGEGIWETAFK